MKKFFIFSLMLLAFAFISCDNKMFNIPSGYVGKIITQTGFEKDIREAGQVDLGTVQSDGTANNLVLLEATSITVKESFEKNDKGEDHRIKLADGYVIVDIYVQFNLPADKKLRENAFNCVTSTPDPSSPRVSIIKLEDIYNKFAKMNVRGKSRSAFKDYKNSEDALKNMDKLNAEVFKIVQGIVDESKMPLELMSVQVSNIKEDEAIVESKNKTESATNEGMTIEKIGKMLQQYPSYVEYYKWQTIAEIMAKNPNATLIIDGSGKGTIQVPAKSK